jgi:hypothetical protein
MTMENWNEVLYIAFKSSVPKYITLLYLNSWIILGNFLLLNLFLAILIDGFTSKPMKNEDDIFFGAEDLECMGIRLNKKRKREEKRKKEEDYALLR